MAKKESKVELKILKTLLNGEKTTAEICKELGYINKKGKTQYNNVDDQLGNLVNKALLNSEKRKIGKPGGPPRYYWINPDELIIVTWKRAFELIEEELERELTSKEKKEISEYSVSLKRMIGGYLKIGTTQDFERVFKIIFSMPIGNLLMFKTIIDNKKKYHKRRSFPPTTKIIEKNLDRFIKFTKEEDLYETEVETIFAENMWEATKNTLNMGLVDEWKNTNFFRKEPLITYEQFYTAISMVSLRFS